MSKIAFLGVVALIAATLFLLGGADVVTFESLESKTDSNGPVYNKISLEASLETDIWKMRQSHDGLSYEAAKWDSLAIVIDKTKSPKIATFYQLDPGEKFRPISYRVKCFICHPNGPRAIRPNESSMSFSERFQIFKWNLKIKSYGRVLSKSYSEKDPIKFSGGFYDAPLKIGLCVICHKETGFLARGTLKRQNFLPISFLTKNGHMPPLGIPLLSATKRELIEFLGVN
ncbi:MAG: hypothetical protein A4S09_01420 [Proteobacteria bacterium SG_bin7]|nr:MAG: hypothetical protein A4S09_01420 [Proteobacteria bacterium SG_bin7]